MPYEISFTKRVDVSDPEEYFNECCHGGDIVSQQLLPDVRAHYERIQHNQEDWGWFIWFRSGNIRLAIDIFCDDPETDQFRIHLTSRIKRAILSDRITDTPELETLKEIVVGCLTKWIGHMPIVQRLDGNYTTVL